MRTISRKIGNRFQDDIANSCDRLGIYNKRLRDVTPNMLKEGMRTAKQPFDYFAYYNDYLFPMELKTTQQKSASFKGSNPLIKEHQIANLTKDDQYDGVIAGIIINFRKYDNQTFYLHINELNKYISVANGEQENTYYSKINQSSIPLAICKEVGVEIPNQLKRTRYTYNMRFLFDELIKKYGR